MASAASDRGRRAAVQTVTLLIYAAAESWCCLRNSERPSRTAPQDRGNGSWFGWRLSSRGHRRAPRWKLIAVWKSLRRHLIRCQFHLLLWNVTIKLQLCPEVYSLRGAGSHLASPANIEATINWNLIVSQSIARNFAYRCSLKILRHWLLPISL